MNDIIDISYGFGYDSKSYDYKFVSIFSETDSYGCSAADIYTLRSDSWKKRCYGFPCKLSNGQPGVFLTGALHWFAKSCMNGKRFILSFDLEEETSKELLLPAEHLDHFDYEFLDVLRGFLCLLCSVSNVKFEIWEMKDYGVRESWSKLFKIDQQQLMTMSIGIQSCHYIKRAVSLRNGEILLEIMAKGQSYGKWRVDIVRIHLEEKKGCEYMKNIDQMEPYVESFVSLNSGTFVGNEEKDYGITVRDIWG
ncbi:F-box/kelch-repeat protein At3g06240-like [Papaver somniferum]|uniref:F-box/kelch-repeat protein At3g06240-like n=1 Tax=Papaver somniferum TaxID=3469 RepID=UPI000E6F4669|nr:F-box/kelch-repeat protein At3g06240-like [Papaver somniferum]